MYKYSKIYWLLRKFEFLRVYFSPFKPFLPKLYVGKTAIGTPYFLPRRWVKATPKRAIEATVKEIREVRNFNKRDNQYKRTERPFRDIYDSKMRCTYPLPLKIGFSFCGLGFKTKWSSVDFRHEYNPVLSFVAFGYQIALIFRPENDSHYWEAYLFYHYATDKTKSSKERIEQCKSEFPQTWTQLSGDREITTDYYNLILK